MSRDPEDAPTRSLTQIKESVKRDLEWLLNSKQLVARLEGDLKHLGRSVLTYGLPECTSANLSNPGDQVALRRAVEEAIVRFEPCLANVVVTLEAGRVSERSLHFRIDAVLQVEPEPEPVTFDSVLQLNNKAFVVKGE
jgi:type VI secretion system protein ImpF